MFENGPRVETFLVFWIYSKIDRLSYWQPLFIPQYERTLNMNKRSELSI